MFVLSAVRTPIGLLNGSLCAFPAGQLSAIAFREALERAVVPVEDIGYLFLGCAFDSNFNEIIKRITLPKSTKILAYKCSLECFVKACEVIHQCNRKVCLAGGVESASNNVLFMKKNSLEAISKSLPKNNFKETFFNYLSNQANHEQIDAKSCNNYISGSKNNAFCDEVVKISFRKKGYQIIVTKDEQIKGSDSSQKIWVVHELVYCSFLMQESNYKTLLFPGDGAAAAVIANEEYVKKNKLTPLARVVSFASEAVSVGKSFSVISKTIRKALDIVGLDSQSVLIWEINALQQSLVFSDVINQLNINPSLINRSGGMFGLGFPVGMYGGKMISHIIHSLSPGQYGCAASLSVNGIASAVVLKKLYTKTSSKPQLMMYTKKVCPLCDDLEKQLKLYKNRFSLQKIDIELDEKLKNLYGYEIPVLFLDGTFLCKHKVDLEHFNWRLRRSEDTPSNCQ